MTHDHSVPQLIKRLRWYDSLEKEGKAELAFELDDDVDRSLKHQGYVIGSGWGKLKITPEGRSYLAQYNTAPKQTAVVRTMITASPMNHRPKTDSTARAAVI